MFFFLLTRTIVWYKIKTERGVKNMKKTLLKYKGAILFYSILVCGILLLNVRFDYLNHQNPKHNTIVQSEIALEN